MAWRNANLVFSITLLCSIVDIIAFKCVVETSCSCHLSDGTFYDLNKLSAEGPLKTNTYNQSYVFSFQPCKNVKMDMIPGNNESDCNNGTGVSLCVLHGGKTFVLGNTTETKWNVGESSAALELDHPPYTTRITLLCCNECTTSNLIFDIEPEKYKYHLVLSTPYACKLHEPRDGLSLGSILVILILVFGGLYFIIGALVLRFLRGAIGWELIPNYDFWCSLPGLCRNGVAHIFSCCSANTYDRI